MLTSICYKLLQVVSKSFINAARSPGWHSTVNVYSHSFCAWSQHLTKTLVSPNIVPFRMLLALSHVLIKKSSSLITQNYIYFDNRIHIDHTILWSKMKDPTLIICSLHFDKGFHLITEYTWIIDILHTLDSASIVIPQFKNWSRDCSPRSFPWNEKIRIFSTS